MTKGIPKGITKAHIIQAIGEFRSGKPHGFSDSIKYDILHDGYRYPPKAILGLASSHLLETPLDPSDFKGGLETKCFRVFQELGFEIVPKKESWRQATINALRRMASRHGQSFFTRKQIIEEELDGIRSSVSSVGATPAQTLSRVLQELRDEGYIKFDGDGGYQLRAVGESPNEELSLPQTADDLFCLSQGDLLSKKHVSKLIQSSKVEGSEHWSGPGGVIGNTPQQGINWIGKFPDLRGVMIRTWPGSYDEDGWLNESKGIYQYSFKSRKEAISYTEKANRALINQPQFQYPILLFLSSGDNLKFEGMFGLVSIQKTSVVLKRNSFGLGGASMVMEESDSKEGGKKYVTHLMAERNRGIVEDLKRSKPWDCEICSGLFIRAYGVEYVEAHHKKPISTYDAAVVPSFDDFALLCPNCHNAVHIYMRKEGLEYEAIRKKLNSMLGDSGADNA